MGPPQFASQNEAAGGKICVHMVINEIFYSLQGEGLLAGVPSVFIRLAGCPLSCEWCDTKYARDPNAGDDLSVSQIIESIQQWQCRHVVITGGEPMINDQLPQLAEALKQKDRHITIETSGIAFIDDLACDLMSISPKTKKGAGPFSIVTRLIKRYPYQLKFVVDSADDLPEIQKVIALLRDVDLSKVMLMPQARTRDELIAKAPLVARLCKQSGLLFCNRLQILLYSDAKGV